MLRAEGMADRRARDATDRRAYETRRMEIHRALGRLRRCPTRRELLDRIHAEVAHSCGFSRVMLSTVRGSRWIPPASTWPAEIPLAATMWETEMVRRRTPILVTDPGHSPRAFADLVAATGTTSYVAAPIAPSRSVIGLLHADRHGQDPAVNEADRDALWLFAENVGLLIERATLSERLDQERRRLNALLRQSATGLDTLCEAGIELGDETPAAARAPGMPGISAAPRRDALLTERERQVLDLVATGATNREVAAVLSLSGDTVKTHISHVLHKLRVTTRAEAAARYRSASDGSP